jgi:hypothetical protein
LMTRKRSASSRTIVEECSDMWLPLAHRVESLSNVNALTAECVGENFLGELRHNLIKNF